MKSILVLALFSVVLVGSVGIADAYEGEIVLERIFHDEERFGDAFYFEGYIESDIPPTLDYTVFVTLYDISGKVMGEFDSRLDETKSRDRGTYQWGFDFYIEGNVYELVPNTDYNLEVIYRDETYNEILSIPPLEESVKIDVGELDFEIIVDPSYRGDSMHIRGQGAPNIIPVITIFSPEGEKIFDEYALNTKPDGRFFNIFGFNELSGNGDYIGYITHQDIKYNFQFTFKKMTDTTITTSQSSEISQQDQDIERLQLQIQKQVNRITELENENFDLQKQIANLNLIIQEQIKVIMDTLLSLKI